MFACLSVRSLSRGSAYAVATTTALVSSLASATVSGEVYGTAPLAFVRVPVNMAPLQVTKGGNVTGRIYNITNSVMLCVERQVGTNWVSATCNRDLVYPAQPGTYRFSVIGSPLNRSPSYKISYSSPG